MANLSGGDDQEAAARAQSSLFSGASSSDSRGYYPLQESVMTLSSVMKHNPGISVHWSPEEQGILEDGLRRCASESSISRYAKIAMMLPDKTVRDVAFRCRWMAARKQNNKIRKEERILRRKGKEKKETIVDQQANQAHFTVQPNVPHSFSPPEHAAGGVTGQLLEQNALAFDRIHANLAVFQIHDNVELLRRTRENIYRIVNNLNSGPETMQKMPPLPETLNEELANAILDFRWF